MEVIGNHTDYNGGLVVGATIDRCIAGAGARRPDRRVRLVSKHSQHAVELDLDNITPRSDEKRWANYPLGVLVALRQVGLSIETGFEIAFASSIPTGAGLSSSAALELASAYVLLEMFPAQFDSLDIARACRRAENEFVGVPSGILDQTVSAMGRTGHVVSIDCLTEIPELIPLPNDVHFWIFNSHRRHSLVGSLYETRHRECQEALAALQQRYPTIRHLADLSEHEVRAAKVILTDVLYRRALHVTTENERVRAAILALRLGDSAGLGRLLVASHSSSRDAFENSTPELDFLVETLVDRRDVLGARLTGGGFGGAVLALTNQGFGDEDAEEVSAAYDARFGTSADIIHCVTSEGAHAVRSDE